MASAVSSPAVRYSATDQQAIEWLLACAEPGIRAQVRRNLLDEPEGESAAAIAGGPWMTQLLAGQHQDGGFGVHPYQKWAGAHWRLVSLVELGIPAGEPRAVDAVNTVLDWLTSAQHQATIKTIEGRTRRCASQEGNALGVASRLGLAGDPRTQQLAAFLVGWQWSDGGWNCDKTRTATHSSFHESLPPVWGLSEYAQATGDADAAHAARRASEFFLQHLLFRSHTTGEIADRNWLRSPYPAYWHYNFTQGLTVMARAGALPDPRADEALSLLRDGRQPDGLWHVGGAPYWRRSGPMYWDPAPWERSGPSLMLTLNAMRVLRAAAA